MAFANCKEVAITLSGTIPDSEVCYGLYTPSTPKETWEKGWQNGIDPTFTHFWVEKDGTIIDHAAEQFGEAPIVKSDYSDIRYIKVGRYIPKEDKTVPLVDNPKIEWETLTGVGGRVNVVFDKYDEYLNKVKNKYGIKNTERWAAV